MRSANRALTALAMAGLLACSGEAPPVESARGDQDAPVVPDGPVTVEVILEDFIIDMPDELPAGELHLTVENVGVENHDLAFVQEGVDSPVWRLERVLGSGERSEATVVLEPGSYTVVCDFSDHVGRGMIMPLTVVERRGG